MSCSVIRENDLFQRQGLNPKSLRPPSLEEHPAEFDVPEHLGLPQAY